MTAYICETCGVQFAPSGEPPEHCLPRAEIERIVAALEPYEFDRIYGAWWERVVASDGKAAVRRSAGRYLRGGSSLATSSRE